MRKNKSCQLKSQQYVKQGQVMVVVGNHKFENLHFVCSKADVLLL